MKERPTAFLGKIGKIGWFFLRSKHNPNITLPGIPKVVPLLDLLEYNKAPNIWAVSRENGIPARVFWVDLNGILGSEVSEYFYLASLGQIQIPSTLPKMMLCEMLPQWKIGIDIAGSKRYPCILHSTQPVGSLYLSQNLWFWLDAFPQLSPSFKTCHQLSCTTQRQALSAGSVGQVDLFNLKKVHLGRRNQAEDHPRATLRYF